MWECLQPTPRLRALYPLPLKVVVVQRNILQEPTILKVYYLDLLIQLWLTNSHFAMPQLESSRKFLQLKLSFPYTLHHHVLESWVTNPTSIQNHKNASLYEPMSQYLYLNLIMHHFLNFNFLPPSHLLQLNDSNLQQILNHVSLLLLQLSLFLVSSILKGRNMLLK